MADSFIITPAETVLPARTPREIAKAVAAAAGAPPLHKQFSGPSLADYIADVILEEDQGGVVRESAHKVLDALISGRLPAYVQAAASGAFFRIPLRYWVMKSEAKNPWDVLEIFDRFTFGAAFDESMKGQPVLVPERLAAAFLSPSAPVDFADEGAEPITRPKRVREPELRAWVESMLDKGASCREAFGERAAAFPGFEAPPKRAVQDIYRELHHAAFGEYPKQHDIHPLLKARRKPQPGCAKRGVP